MVQRVHRHRAWVNRNLQDAATALTDDLSGADLPQTMLIAMARQEGS